MRLYPKGKAKIILLFIALLVTFYLLVPHAILARQHSKVSKVSKNSVSIPTPTVTATLTPTRIPTSTPIPKKIRPTLTSTPTPTKVKPTPTVTPSATSPSSSGISQLLDEVNKYRASKGLSAVKSDSYTCSFAALRANEIINSFNHDGFSNRINARTLPYPSYHEVTENIAMTTNINDVVTMWINSPGHAANMQKDTPFVCIEKSGNYYAYEGWRP